MGNLLLTVYKELQKNNPFAHEYMEVVLEQIQVEKRLSKLTAVIHSSRLLSYAAIEYFAMYMHQKYPRFSIDVTNTFDKESLSEKDFPTLFRLFSESIKTVPSLFFEEAEVDLQDKEITVNVAQGKSFLDAIDFVTLFSDYILYLTGKEYKIKLIQAKEPSKTKVPVYELENKVVKIVEKSKYDDFEIPGLKIKKDSVKVVHGKYQSVKPKDFISIDQALNDTGKVTVWGKVFAVTEQGNFRKIFIYSITDGSNSINLKILLDPNDKNIEKWESIKPGVHFAVRGDCQMDKYERDFVIMPYDIISFSLQEKKDTAEEKRVELHLHTKLSAMDALVEPGDAVRKAYKYGHRAVAITDHGVVQGFPQAMLECDAIRKENPDADFKVIYGCEGYLVDNTVDIYTGNRADAIADTEFVVFDIETTGLTPNTENITEIGAVLVKGEEVLDEFHTFVDPEKHIPERITELTGITDEMVKGAPSQADAITAFKEFIGDRIIIAHNAVSFDVNFIQVVGERLGISFEYEVIDTLPLAQNLLTDLKKHKLDIVAEHYNLGNFNHHRATDDAKMLFEILKCMEKDLAEKGITQLNQINAGLSSTQKLPRKSNHIILICKNKAGLKNLYKLISFGHLKYFFKQPRMPKSEIIAHREGLIIGSACEAGELYRAVVEGKPHKELLKIASFYDFLEVQPLGNNEYMLREGIVESIEQIKDFNRKIIQLGEELNIPVVATGDVHFMTMEDSKYRAILMAGMGFSDADNQAPLYFRNAGRIQLSVA